MQKKVHNYFQTEIRWIYRLHMVTLLTSEVDYNNFIALGDYPDHFRLQN